MGGMSAPAFDTLKTDLETLRVDIRTLRVDVRALRADIRTLTVDVRALRADIQALSGYVQALQLSIAEKFEALYKHLWFMGAGVVAANAAVVTVLITLLT